MKPISRFLLAVLLSSAYTNPLLGQWIQTKGNDGSDLVSLTGSGMDIFVGTDIGGVFLSTDDGTSWSQIKPFIDTAVYVLTMSGANLIAGTNSGGMFFSTDNGGSWAWDALISSPPENIWCFAASGAHLFTGTDNGVYLSTNSGTSWTQAGLTDTTVWSLVVSDTNLFAGTWGEGVFLSTNEGTSWTPANTSLTDSTWVTSLVASGTNLLAAIFRAGVVLSRDNGKTWVKSEGGLPDTTGVWCFAISGTNVFAGASPGGMFLSTDNGVSWAPEGLQDEGVLSRHLRQVSSCGNLWWGGMAPSTFGDDNWCQ